MSSERPFKTIDGYGTAPNISHVDILERMIKLEQRLETYLEYDRDRNDAVEKQIEEIAKATMQNTIEIRTISRLAAAVLMTMAVLEGLRTFGVIV